MTHNGIFFTDNNWASVRTALGKHRYYYYDEVQHKPVQTTGYGLSADFVSANASISSPQIIGGQIFSVNYNPEDKTGSMIDLQFGEFSFGGDSLYYRDGQFVISDTVIGQSLESIDIKAENLHIEAGNIDGLLQAEQIDVQNLYVNTANIKGVLSAEQIDAENLHIEAGNVDGEFVAKTIIGGQIYSSDYIENETNPTAHIDLDNGEFSLGKKLVFKDGQLVWY